MKSTPIGQYLTGFLLAALLAAPAIAEEVYRWVDENGVTHFSQMPPDEVTGVTQQTLRDTRPSDYDPEQDLYNVEAQAERMQQLRDERKEKRQAARLEREREAERQQIMQYQNRQYYGYPNYRPGWVNPHPPLRPTPPVARPPETLLPMPPVARPPSISSGPG